MTSSHWEWVRIIFWRKFQEVRRAWWGRETGGGRMVRGEAEGICAANNFSSSPRFEFETRWWRHNLFAASSGIASFTYNDVTGLLRSSARGFATTFYIYDAQGRLVSTTSSTGAMTSLHASSNATVHTVTMKTIATSAGEEQTGVGSRNVIISTEPGYICDVITTVEGKTDNYNLEDERIVTSLILDWLCAGAMRTVYRIWTDNSISVRYLDESELILETKPHPVLGLTSPSLAKRTIQLPSDPLESKIEWRRRKEEENGEDSLR